MVFKSIKTLLKHVQKLKLIAKLKSMPQDSYESIISPKCTQGSCSAFVINSTFFFFFFFSFFLSLIHTSNKTFTTLKSVIESPNESLCY